MYSFACRNDFAVLDEPFYGYYLQNAKLQVKHPSHDEIIAMMECEEHKIVHNINKLAMKQNVFIKGMAHHLLAEKPSYITDWINVILIRHPLKLIASFSKIIPNPTLADIGIKKASELASFLIEQGVDPIVIESEELMINPRRYLKKLCDLLDISFSDQMLKWEAGGIPEDGVWAKHWYDNVHNTTGFEEQKQKTIKIAPQLGPLLAEAQPYYESLQPFILKND